MESDAKGQQDSDDEIWTLASINSLKKKEERAEVFLNNTHCFSCAKEVPEEIRGYYGNKQWKNLDIPEPDISDYRIYQWKNNCDGGKKQKGEDNLLACDSCSKTDSWGTRPKGKSKSKSIQVPYFFLESLNKIAGFDEANPGHQVESALHRFILHNHGFRILAPRGRIIEIENEEAFKDVIRQGIKEYFDSEIKELSENLQKIQGDINNLTNSIEGNIDDITQLSKPVSDPLENLIAEIKLEVNPEEEWVIQYGGKLVATLPKTEPKYERSKYRNKTPPSTREIKEVLNYLQDSI